MSTEQAFRDATVIGYQCWGCNRIKLPKPWTPACIPLLRAERRLVMREYLCENDDCPANDIAGIRSSMKQERRVKR